MRATVVVVTWNGAHLLPACLDSLVAQTVDHDVLVVDNASTDGTTELLARRHPDVRVLRLPVNTGFAGGAQAGLDAADTDVVALLNNDAEADPGWLAALLAGLARHPRAAAVTSRIVLRADGRINNVGGGLTRLAVGFDLGLGQPDGPAFDTECEVATFSGGAAALRTDVARTVGGFDTALFLYYEDTDLSWRLRRAGHEIWYVPDARVRHLHSATTDQASSVFAFHNQRNQLVVAVRNAPARVAVVGLLRFLAVTAVAVVRPRGGLQQDPRHRLRVLGAVLRMLPGALADRRTMQRSAVVTRTAFARRWLTGHPGDGA